MHVLTSPPHDPTIFSLSIHEHAEKRWQQPDRVIFWPVALHVMRKMLQTISK